METVRKRLQKTMIVIMRKYYKRSHKLLLTRYHKLKNSNGLNRLKSINRKTLENYIFEGFKRCHPDLNRG